MVAVGNIERPTYCRILIRPFDTRPIVIVLREDWLETGECFISDGDSMDMTEVEVVLDMIRNWIADEHVARLGKEMLIANKKKAGDFTDVESPPF